MLRRPVPFRVVVIRCANFWRQTVVCKQPTAARRASRSEIQLVRNFKRDQVTASDINNDTVIINMAEETARKENTFMGSRSAFLSFLRQPSTLAELQAGQQVFAREEVQLFLATLRTISSAEESNSILRDLVPLILEIDSFHAGMLALLCGSLVEGGGNASLVIDSVMEQLVQQLGQVRDYMRTDEDLDIQEMFQKFPQASRAQAALSFTIPASMTMLCRDKEARKQWQCRRDLLELVDELDDAERIPSFLKSTLGLLDDKDLVVVDKQNRRAFLARLVGVRDRLYHCYALLQHALLEHAGPGYLDAEASDLRAVRYAQNDHLTQSEYAEAKELRETQRFDFCYAGGLFIPGSMSFSGLPVFRNQPYLLVAKKGTTCSPSVHWDPTNAYPALHEALEARVDIVRELTGNEVEFWLTFLSDEAC